MIPAGDGAIEFHINSYIRHELNWVGSELAFDSAEMNVRFVSQRHNSQLMAYPKDGRACISSIATDRSMTGTIEEPVALSSITAHILPYGHDRASSPWERC